MEQRKQFMFHEGVPLKHVAVALNREIALGNGDCRIDKICAKESIFTDSPYVACFFNFMADEQENMRRDKNFTERQLKKQIEEIERLGD